MSLLKSVKDFIGFGKAKDFKDSWVGIEFENELKIEDPPNIFQTSTTYWKFHKEDSLRHFGFEFVSVPLPLKMVPKQTKLLFERHRTSLDTEALPYTNSIRTSVHVHFDVTLYDSFKLGTFLCLYWMLEPFLSAYCGPHRSGNLFCLRLSDSGFTRDAIAKQILNSGSLYQISLNNDNFRYASVNLASMRKFGTLEFRLMRGVSEETDALQWISALEAIRSFALRFDTPKDLRKWFLKDVLAQDVPKEVLGEGLATVFTDYLDLPSLKGSMVQQGYVNAISVFQAFEKKSVEKEKAAEDAMLKKLDALTKKAKTTGFINSAFSSAGIGGGDITDMTWIELAELTEDVPVSDHLQLDFQEQDLLDDDIEE